MKNISEMVLDSETLEIRKSLAIITVTAELLKLGAKGTDTLFQDELRSAVAKISDTEFLGSLYSSTTPTASAGDTLAAIEEDLGVLLAAVASGARSRLYFVIDAVNARHMALQSLGSGARAFPSLGVNGGEVIPGVMCLVSDNLPDGAALLIDASQIIADSGVVTLNSAKYASVQMETSSDSPATSSTNMVSLWQRGLVALKAERYWGYRLMRSTAVASLSGVDYSAG